MTPDVLYAERQHFTQVWLWALILRVAALFCTGRREWRWASSVRCDLRGAPVGL